MKEDHRERVESKGIFYDELEEYAREKIREHLQELLEQEVSEWLGREKSQRKANGISKRLRQGKAVYVERGDSRGEAATSEEFRGAVYLKGAAFI
jgi:hypothetical protein